MYVARHCRVQYMMVVRAERVRRFPATPGCIPLIGMSIRDVLS